MFIEERTMEAIVLALNAAEHIAECGEHPDHLLDAETKARRALSMIFTLRPLDVIRIPGNSRDEPYTVRSSSEEDS